MHGYTRCVWMLWVMSMACMPHFMHAGERLMVVRKTLTMRTILSWIIPTEIALSPDGKKVAVVVRTTDWKKSQYRYELRVYEIATGTYARIMPPGASIHHLRWSADSRWLAFITQRDAEEPSDEDSDETENPRPQAWVWSVHRGQPQVVTHLPRGVMDLAWLPQRRVLIVLTEQPQPDAERAVEAHRKKRRDDEEVVDAEKYRRAFVRVEIKSDLSAGEPEWIYIGDYGIDEFVIHPDGRWAVYATNYSGKPDDYMRYDLWALHLDRGDAVQLTDAEGPESRPRFSPDGRRLAFLALWDPQHSFSRVDAVVIPWPTRPASVVAREQWQFVSAPIDADIDDLAWISPRYLALQVERGVWEWVYRVDVRGGEPEILLGGDRVITQMDWVAGRNRPWVVVWENATTLPDVWIVLPKSREPQRLTDLNPSLKEYRLAPQRVVQWRSFDGQTIEGIFVAPLESPDRGKPPLLVAVHGGPKGRAVNTLRQYYYYQFFAAHGYAVLAPNFRGSSGYGHAFAIANFRDLGGGDFRDIMHGVDYVIAQGWVDPEKLGIFGGSYGGYMTNWAITQTQRFRAAVSMFGIFNLITDFSNSYLPSWEPDYLGDYYWNDIERYLERSPARYVKNVTTPVLIIHGKEDPNTFISNSKEMYQALRFLDRTVEFVVYPREGHGLREPWHKLDEMRRVLQWFDRYILGREQYWLGDAVEAEGWQMRVVEWTRDRTPGNRAQNTQQYVLELVLTPTETAAPDLELRIVHPDGSDLRIVDQHGQTWTPAAVLQKLWASSARLTGSDIRMRCTARDAGGTRPSFALRVLFTFPKDTEIDALRLYVWKFPPVNLRYP